MDDRSFGCMHLNEDAEGKQGLYLSRDLLDVTIEAIEDNITHLCYKHSFKHICILATCKNTLDELQKKLELTDEDMEASRRTLERFGNTSSSSIWYELAYLEASGRVKKGDRVWQLAFGSGFKCTSIVWEALGSIERRPHRRSLWMEYVATD